MSDKQVSLADLKVGDIAPDFDLPSTGEKHIRLSSLRGKPVVLFFYPKDGTPGCTDEARAFSAAVARFDETGTVVLGISPDSMKRHESFKAKHGLNVDLIADEAHEALSLYGVWKEKKTFGIAYMGVERSTFIIDPAGRIAATWRKVKVAGHVDEVLAHLDRM